jgi:hypothetical protein
MLLNLDRSFKIELAWVAQGAHRALEEAIHKKVVACFPTKDITISLAQCEARLSALMSSTMYKCATRASQSAVQTIRSVVGKMTRGIAPAESIKTGGGLFSQVWTHMQFFIKHTPSSGSKKGQELHGQDALCAKLQALEAIIAKESRAAQLFELEVFKATYSIHRTHKDYTNACDKPLQCERLLVSALARHPPSWHCVVLRSSSGGCQQLTWRRSTP